MSISISNIKTSEALMNGARSVMPLEQDIMSLDDRLIQSFSRTAINAGAEKNSILQKIEDPNSVTDPAELFSLQLRTSNYNLEVSLISTLTRKSVGAVETLLRS